MMFSVALAAEGVPAPVQEEWADGLTARPITSPVVQVDGAFVALGAEAPAFGGFSAGYGQALGRGLLLGGGLAGSVVHPDSPTGPALALRTGGAEVWLSFERGALRHGFGTAVQLAVSPYAGWYLRHPAEAGTRALGTYDLLWDLGALDVSVDARLGMSTVWGPQLSGAAAAVYELHPRVALVAGGEVALAPTGTVSVGVDARPADGLEVSATLGVPVPLFEDQIRASDLELQPGLRLKAWF